MELWIRSQNKRMLTKLDYCYLEPVHKREILGGNHYLINQSLGIYPTEKRALEVLDEIQNRLMPCSDIIQDTEGITISYKNVSTIIYEMPKE